MPEFSPDLLRAYRRRAAPCLLFYCDHPSGVIRAWSRTGNIVHDGHIWYGLGVLGDITGPSNTVQVAVRETRFTLYKVPPSASSFLRDEITGRVAQVWMAAMYKGGKLVVDDDPIIDAVLDVTEPDVDPVSGTMTVTLVGYGGFRALDRSQNVACSHEQHQIEYPGSRGLSRMPSLVDKQARWRSA